MHALACPRRNKNSNAVLAHNKRFCSFDVQITTFVFFFIPPTRLDRPQWVVHLAGWPCPGQTAEVHMSSPTRWGVSGDGGRAQLSPHPHPITLSQSLDRATNMAAQATLAIR